MSRLVSDLSIRSIILTGSNSVLLVWFLVALITYFQLLMELYFVGFCLWFFSQVDLDLCSPVALQWLQLASPRTPTIQDQALYNVLHSSPILFPYLKFPTLIPLVEDTAPFCSLTI